jgi:serine/threonine-protein kinase
MSSAQPAERPDPALDETEIRSKVVVYDLDSYVRMVTRSQLIPGGLLRRLAEEVRHRDCGDLPSHRLLARLLISRGLLSPWQDHQLMQGRWHGFNFGQYRLLDRLGDGGMGRVYLAEQTVMRRRVALKVLPVRMARNELSRKRFDRESRAQASIDHPNVVRLYDAGTVGEAPYLALEYVPGIDLDRLVQQQGPLSPELAADTIRQAALGLAHVHAAGLIHRDIKPANIMVTQSGQAKLLDLGVARFDGEDELLTLASRGCLVGTIDYLAPEQALDSHDVDQRADIYSLGCTLYYLLTGRVPFPTGSQAEKILSHQVREADAIEDERPEVPARLIQICSWMMSKDPADRPQSAVDLAEALTDWLRSVGRVTPPVLAPRVVPPTKGDASTINATASKAEMKTQSAKAADESSVEMSTEPAKKSWMFRRASAPGTGGPSSSNVTPVAFARPSASARRSAPAKRILLNDDGPFGDYPRT